MKIVYDTAVQEIEMLNNLNPEEVTPQLLKLSAMKNQHILSIIKQQEIDYKLQDLELRTIMYNIRTERNSIMKDNITLQKEKLK